MADVNIEIASRFFSLHGFFVRTGDFLYIKKLKTGRAESRDFVYSGSGLEAVQNAVVSVKPWHSQAFYPSLITGSREDIFRFLERDELKKAEKTLGHPGFKKFLVLSSLPRQKETRGKSVELLEAEGVDMVFEFADLLDYLIKNIRKTRPQSDDEVSRIIRILNCYGFCGAGQPELFSL